MIFVSLPTGRIYITATHGPHWLRVCVNVTAADLSGDGGLWAALLEVTREMSARLERIGYRDHWARSSVRAMRGFAFNQALLEESSQ